MSCISVILCIQLMILADIHVAADSANVLRHDIIGVYLGTGP